MSPRLFLKDSGGRFYPELNGAMLGLGLSQGRAFLVLPLDLCLFASGSAVTLRSLLRIASKS
jgi:hypothetical protein